LSKDTEWYTKRGMGAGAHAWPIPGRTPGDHTNRMVWISIDRVTKPTLATVDAEIERRKEAL
jgi:hypothetical protein